MLFISFWEQLILILMSDLKASRKWVDSAFIDTVRSHVFKGCKVELNIVRRGCETRCHLAGQPGVLSLGLGSLEVSSPGPPFLLAHSHACWQGWLFTGY